MWRVTGSYPLHDLAGLLAMNLDLGAEANLSSEPAYLMYVNLFNKATATMKPNEIGYYAMFLNAQFMLGGDGLTKKHIKVLFGRNHNTAFKALEDELLYRDGKYYVDWLYRVTVIRKRKIAINKFNASNKK